MALPILEAATTASFYLLSAVAIVLVFFVLYVLRTISSFLVFYTKESIHGKGRPPIAGTLFHEFFLHDTIFDFETDIARKHKTFRFVKTSYSGNYTTDPANIEHMLKSSFSKYQKGERNHDVMRDLFGDGIFAVDGDQWRHQRKLASYEFSTKVLRDFSSVVFRNNGAKLAKKISEAASSSAVFDMQEFLMKSTLDSIFKVGFGVELDTLSGSAELGSRFSKAFDDANYIVFRRYSDVFWDLKRYLNVGQEAQLKKHIKVIDDFVFQLIRRKRELMKNGADDKDDTKEDILSRFILASEKDPEAITDQYLRDIILNFLIAGKDTTANTLTWFFYLICKQPLVQEKIAAEIQDSLRISTGEGRDIDSFCAILNDHEVVDRMHYLHAAITETLRLYPAVPVDGKSAQEDDILPDGFKVKKGDVLNYHAYAMGRMTYLWGEDAEDFRPERWIENGSFKPESQFKFPAFNGGPRICLGKEFAYRQMKILAAILVHSFRFKLRDESKTATYRTMFTLHMDNGLPIIASHRNN
ncbi:cytochrome P450 704C1-like isoform X1 [Iris pallida]|uniref:noroxomaritidine synthase n=1 Tax=Iris pallida TaxID=29817 RepID=A0AAX6HIF1_IRIPA|nr:cytochrome P450 704C1-like isoform X1 [Iris pallida]